MIIEQANLSTALWSHTGSISAPQPVLVFIVTAISYTFFFYNIIWTLTSVVTSFYVAKVQ